MSGAAAALAPDLERGLKRLKLRAVRTLAPEVLQTAKVQRWAPEELLRTLVEAEVSARDASNLRARLRSAAFPVRKSVEEFKVAESAVPQTTFNYLASLEWVRAKENLVLVGPAGTGKSHLLVALGHAAVAAGLRVRYFAAVDLVEDLSTRAAASCSSASSRRCTSAAAWPSPAIGRSRSGVASFPRRSPRRRCWTASSTTPPWSSPAARASG